jgi:nucleoside phosphorylase
VISTGFAGALDDSSAIGDIAVYSELKCETESGKETQKTLLPDRRLMSLALSRNKVGSVVLDRTGVTCSVVCGTPASKKTLGRRCGASVVDMESYWIGKAAAKRNVPFLAVRTISDTVNDDISVLDELITGETLNRTALKYLATHPKGVAILFSYYKKAKKAERSLSLFLREMIEKI